MTNVVIVGHDDAPDACTKDERFADVMDAALAAPNMIDLVLLAIREYDTHEHLRNGRGHENRGLAAHVDRQKYGPAERSRAKRIVKALGGLYRDFDPSHVRGMLLEHLVEQQIRPRYSGTDCLCDNNVKIELGPSASRHRTSSGLDVLGWDGHVGEGHDCKADTVNWARKKAWLKELDEEVASRGLRVGLVTADSQTVARRKLKREGIECPRLTLVHGDRMASTLPLHK